MFEWDGVWKRDGVKKLTYDWPLRARLEQQEAK